MRYCAHCGCEAADEARFCKSCGWKLTEGSEPPQIEMGGQVHSAPAAKGRGQWPVVLVAALVVAGVGGALCLGGILPPRDGPPPQPPVQSVGAPGSSAASTSSAPTTSQQPAQSQEGLQTVFLPSKMTVLNEQGETVEWTDFTYDVAAGTFQQEDVQKRGEIRRTIRASYSQDGKLLDVFQYHDLGAGMTYSERSSRTYNANGDIVTYTTYVDDVLESRVQTTYDNDGRMLEQIEYGADGILYGGARYTYDGEGKQIAAEAYKEKIDPKGMRMYINQGRTVFATDKESDEAEFGVKETYVCNEKGEFLTIKNYNSRDELLFVVENQYDAMGNQMTWKKIDPAGNIISQWESTFDAQGRESSYWRRFGSSPGSLTQYTYDDRGNRLGEKEFDEDGEMSSWVENTYDQNGSLLTSSTRAGYSQGARTENTYDDNGNLIRQVIYEAGGKFSYEYRYTYTALQVPQTHLLMAEAMDPLNT